MKFRASFDLQPEELKTWVFETVEIEDKKFVHCSFNFNRGSKKHFSQVTFEKLISLEAYQKVQKEAEALQKKEPEQNYPQVFLWFAFIFADRFIWERL